MPIIAVSIAPEVSASIPEKAGPNTTPTAVFLPKEHGSWFLALEPLALGLLVAPSWAGGAFAGAVMAGFFARRPLKAVQVRNGEARSAVAGTALIILALLAAMGVVEAVMLAGWKPLWPLLLALPLGAVFIRHDVQNLSRLPAAELAGCAAFDLIPAVLVLQAGGRGGDAVLLSGVALARGIPTVLTVRAYLRLSKGQSVSAVGAVFASAVAAVFLLVLGQVQVLPRVAGVLGLVLLVRAVWLLGPLRPCWTARRIGQLEAALGVFYVSLSALFW